MKGAGKKIFVSGAQNISTFPFFLVEAAGFEWNPGPRSGERASAWCTRSFGEHKAFVLFKRTSAIEVKKKDSSKKKNGPGPMPRTVRRTRSLIGLCYHEKGTTIDKVLSVEWFRKAADQGHAKAQHSTASGARIIAATAP